MWMLTCLWEMRIRWDSSVDGYENVSCSSGGRAAVRCGSGRAAVRAYQYLRDSTNLLLSITLFCVLLYSHACCADSVLAICGCTYYCKTLSVYIKNREWRGACTPQVLKNWTNGNPLGYSPTGWVESALRTYWGGMPCGAFANFPFNTCFATHVVE